MRPKNRHLFEVVQALIFITNMFKTFWRDIVLTTTYLIDRIPSDILYFQTSLQKFQDFFLVSHWHPSKYLGVLPLFIFTLLIDPN